jgi:hypothetical protein
MTGLEVCGQFISQTSHAKGPALEEPQYGKQKELHVNVEANNSYADEILHRFRMHSGLWVVNNCYAGLLFGKLCMDYLSSFFVTYIPLLISTSGLHLPTSLPCISDYILILVTPVLENFHGVFKSKATCGLFA